MSTTVFSNWIFIKISQFVVFSEYESLILLQLDQIFPSNLLTEIKSQSCPINSHEIGCI